MEKYTKRYIRFVNNIYQEKMQTRHMPARDPYFIIGKYGQDMEKAREKLSMELQGCMGIVAIQFFDKSYIIEDDIKYESEPYNYSGLIYFGDKIKLSLYEDGQLVDKNFCNVDGVSYVLRDEDISYDEYVDNYLKTIDKKKTLVKTK